MDKLIITSLDQLDLKKSYSYADYLTWQFDEMVELIKGKIFKMSPGPNRYHQEVSGNLYIQIRQLLQNSQCKAYHAPFDVRLPLPEHRQTPEQIDTVVQPDICIVCDLDKLDNQGCNGAPDWIIEILSPATSNRDLTEKFDIYQSSGVKEYWIVHPTDATVIPYRLSEDGLYKTLRMTPFGIEDEIPSSIFPGYVLKLKEVFAT